MEVLNMSNIINHYTSGDVFTSILLSKTIRFGDITCMNDYDESKFGINQWFEGIRLSNIEGIDEKVANEIDKLALEQKEMLENNPKYKVFAMCLSIDDDLLCMWNYYLKNSNIGGYNIGFDKDLLIAYLYENIIKKINGAILLHGEIQYLKDEEVLNRYHILTEKIFTKSLKNSSYANILFNLAENMLKDKFKNEEERNEAFQKFKEEGNKLESNIVNSKLGSIYMRTDNGDVLNHSWMNYFIKGYGFRDEREYRIIIAIPTNELDVNTSNNRKTSVYGYGTVYANGMIKPYIAVPFNKEAITQIVISPYNSNRNPIKNTDEFCKNLNIDANIKLSDLTVEF